MEDDTLRGRKIKVGRWQPELDKRLMTERKELPWEFPVSSSPAVTASNHSVRQPTETAFPSLRPLGFCPLQCGRKVKVDHGAFRLKI